MTAAISIAMGLALLSAFAAIVFGRNWTRSLAAGFGFIGALGLCLLLAKAGLLGLVIVILGAMMLGVIQLFGWMLVDVDRDHLPATDRPTSIARGTAFGLLGGGLILLFREALLAGEFAWAAQLEEGLVSSDPVGTIGLGLLLFGPMRDLVTLLGFVIAASLLATLVLLQDDEGNN